MIIKLAKSIILAGCSVLFWWLAIEMAKAGATMPFMLFAVLASLFVVGVFFQLKEAFKK